MNNNAEFGRAAGADPVTSAQMKEIERRADQAGLSYYQMMENAGTGAADLIAAEHPAEGRRIHIFCGKGNNGGDGFVAARKLTEIGAWVSLFLVEGQPRTEDAIKNKGLCEKMGISITDLSTGVAGTDISGPADVIIDAIYGTGFHGELREPVREITKQINGANAVVYALDVPSGLNADTGEADRDSLRADSTIVFHRLKPAHLMEQCACLCGKVICIKIGIDEVLQRSEFTEQPG
jgi:yjeF N-terminal region